ncbi:MAG: hypothetical protein F2534_14610, partial [Actinobacteria bacterium]|nr:hypothetical protein [Actinomycetota bacterium]
MTTIRNLPTAATIDPSMLPNTASETARQRLADHADRFAEFFERALDDRPRDTGVGSDRRHEVRDDRSDDRFRTGSTDDRDAVGRTRSDEVRDREPDRARDDVAGRGDGQRVDGASARRR